MENLRCLSLNEFEQRWLTNCLVWLTGRESFSAFKLPQRSCHKLPGKKVETEIGTRPVELSGMHIPTPMGFLGTFLGC